MNSKQRVMSILKNKIPDRVPIFEIIIDKKVIDVIKPNGGYIALADEYLDLALTNTPSLLYRNKYISKNKGIYVNEWGIVRQESNQSISMPVEGPIKNKEDLINYKTPDPDDEYRYIELNNLLKKFRNKKAVGMHIHDVFSYPSYLRGMENFLIDMVTDKEFVKRLVEITLEHNIIIAKKAIKMGADFIVLGDDYGTSSGPIFSPSCFEELLLPGLKLIISEIKKSGGFVIKHCCGNINSLLDMIIEAGVDGLNPLDQAAGMDISKVQKKYMDKIFVIGGIDCGDLLTNRSPDDVVLETKRVLKEISSKGRHIISSSSSIHHNVKPENYLAMIGAVKEFGKFPINI